MPYDAQLRLEEQVSILSRDGSPPSIVLMSNLGPEAIPLLMDELVAKTKDRYGNTSFRLDHNQAVALVRALGMMAHEAAAPPLVDWFTRLKIDSNRENELFRAGANALRKIGTDACLQAIVKRLDSFDAPHAITTIDAFGDKGRVLILDQLRQPAEHPRLRAISIASGFDGEETGKLLLAILGNSKQYSEAVYAARALTSRTGLPVSPLVSALAKEMHMREGDDNKYWGRDEGSDEYWDEEGDPDDLCTALLAAIWHGVGVIAVPHLVPLAAAEGRVRVRSYRGYRSTPVQDAIVAFGRSALPFIQGGQIDQYNEDGRDIATRLATKIIDGENVDKPPSWLPGKLGRTMEVWQ